MSLGAQSYAQNSSLRVIHYVNISMSFFTCYFYNARKLGRKTRGMVDHMTINTIVDFYLREEPHRLNIADLGCSSGPNTVYLVKEIINQIENKCKTKSLEEPEVHVFLNDLPANDFNSIFINLPNFIQNLSEFGRRHGPTSVFFAGVPGSFYGRLFPRNSLHFVHSSYCLHWLSQVPPGIFDENGKAIDKGKKICISEESSPLVLKAYCEQFQIDFSLFLKSRSDEIVLGGRMVLIMLGRRTSDHSDKGASFLWDLLSEAFTVMVAKGEIEEEQKVESYKTHFYPPSMAEIETEVKRDGSFVIDRFEMFERDSEHEDNDEHEDSTRNGNEITNAVRAIQEPMILHHSEEGVCDDLFKLYGELVNQRLNQDYLSAVSLILVLTKLS